MSERIVQVYVDLEGVSHHVGRLWCRFKNGRQSASFQYDEAWLQNPQHFALEPALSLTQGTFHTDLEHEQFGAIGDSAPDRWGRMLMRRVEARRARTLGERPRSLGELDYLLGVNDVARQGALRFSEQQGDPFLDQSNTSSIPPLLELPKLLAASEKVLDDQDNDEDLRLLLAPGASLGGARPKASIIDHDGTLAIAKFPREDDEYSIVLWEALALQLAEKAKINVVQSKVVSILNKSILLIRRFDRLGIERLPYLSAMSLLGARDNDQHSYLEIVAVIKQYGASPASDLTELWRRIVFNILISNTDDHLRNHGFLYEKYKGWRLSPMFDTNPVPETIRPRYLTTYITMEDNFASLDLALSIHKDFGLKLSDAQQIIREVSDATITWRTHAAKLGIKKAEIERMETAFEHRDAEQSRTI